MLSLIVTDLSQVSADLYARHGRMSKKEIIVAQTKILSISKELSEYSEALEILQEWNDDID
jgi:hypothetical protein